VIFDIRQPETYNYSDDNHLKVAFLVNSEGSNKVAEEQALEIDQIKKSLEMLDERLDNIDSMVSAVAERVMKQPLTFNITCSKCGQTIEIALVGAEKPRP